MTIFLDDCSKPILDVWRGLEAASLDRVVRMPTGGPAGANDPYWKMIVKNGDAAAMWLPGGQKTAGTGSERTEVGRNSQFYAPFLYKEGERRVTVVTRRLPERNAVHVHRDDEHAARRTVPPARRRLPAHSKSFHHCSHGKDDSRMTRLDGIDKALLCLYILIIVLAFLIKL